MASNPAEFCREPQRRHDIRARGSNGINFIELGDDRLTLSVFLLGRAPETISAENIQITGGVRIRKIKVVSIRLRGPDDPENDNVIELVVDRVGDLSIYTLSLVEVDEHGQPTNRPIAGFDPLYARADFNFNIAVTTDFDCRPISTCAEPLWPRPEINYLAKDYASFRQLMLDRLSVIMPDWQERHVPDAMLALVEILAYVGDYLSYYQDAVATEAYLDTARQRISVRRHARLVDYAMHEGCNARAWVFVHAGQDIALDAKGIRFLVGYDRGAAETGAPLAPDDIAESVRGRLDVFQPMASGEIDLREAHNEIVFYTWGNRQCCLAAGATSATLLDGWEEAPVAQVSKESPPEERAPPKRATRAASRRTSDDKTMAASKEPASSYKQPYAPAKEPEGPCRVRRLRLKPGDFLLVEEIKGPASGKPADANRAHRHVVRLTSVTERIDPLYQAPESQDHERPVPVLEVTWAAEDALPFALVLSSATDRSPSDEISVARGNLILTDHCKWIGTSGRIHNEELGEQVAGRKFRPVLSYGPLTHRAPSTDTTPATLACVQDPALAIPDITVISIPPLRYRSAHQKADEPSTLFTFAELENPRLLAARLAANPNDASSNAVHGRVSSSVDLVDGQVDEDRIKALEKELRRLVRVWTPQRDLMSSTARDRHFVVEMDDAGFAHLRFGDGQLGMVPEPGEVFAATYRVGIGTSGNVGSDSISEIVLGNALSGGVLKPRNPLPATGGIDPESIAKVKLVAPRAFRSRLERAVSAEDYARLAERSPKVQRAAAELRWTGTRYEVRVAIDPCGTEQVDPLLLRHIRSHLFRYRRIGDDMVVVPPEYVPLDLAMVVYILRGYSRSHVEAAVFDSFSNRALPGGKRGLFHPDNLSFGDNIYVSRLMAAAQHIAGVERVVIARLQRMFAGPNEELENGVLPIGPLQIARLDSSAVDLDHGRFILTLRGGQ